VSIATPNLCPSRCCDQQGYRSTINRAVGVQSAGLRLFSTPDPKKLQFPSMSLNWCAGGQRKGGRHAWASRAVAPKSRGRLCLVYQPLLMHSKLAEPANRAAAGPRLASEVAARRAAAARPVGSGACSLGDRNAIPSNPHSHSTIRRSCCQLTMAARRT
jgi:hypothetical protein